MTATDVTPASTPSVRKDAKKGLLSGSAQSQIGMGGSMHLSRRQRKNRKQGVDGKAQAEATGTTAGSVNNNGHAGNGNSKAKKRSNALSLYTALSTSDEKIYEALERYLLMPEALRSLGFPMESELNPGWAFIMSNLSGYGANSKLQEDYVCELDEQGPEKLLNPNAREFHPRSQPQSPNLSKRSNGKRSVEGNEEGPLRTSASSHALSPTAEEFVPKSKKYSQVPQDLKQQMGDAGFSLSGSSKSVAANGSQQRKTSEDEVIIRRVASDSFAVDKDGAVSKPVPKKCMRCCRLFYVQDGVYLRPEKCLYHWGKLKWVAGTKLQVYQCCGKNKRERGCEQATVHVWKGLDGTDGIQYFENFVVTKMPKRVYSSSNGTGAFLPNFPGVYAMDAEMAFTAFGLELVRLTVVGVDGRLVYEAYVKPEHEIVDYNTRYSGLSARELGRLANKTLKEVQNDIMGFLTAKSILIGHGLENDLRVLRLVHMTVIDTSVVFMEEGGYNMRHSLKHLAKVRLGKNIQTSEYGHDSREDAVTCMELMLLKVNEDLTEGGIIRR